jgi:predicted HTH domain antitoxin
MNITIPDEILKSAQMSEDDLKLELAILLYQQKKISTGQARRLAGMHLVQFQQEMSKRGVCVNYDVADFQADVQTLKRLGEL